MQTPHDFRISLTKEELRLFKSSRIKKILEVFCDDAHNLIALSELGYQAVGIEKNKELLERARERTGGRIQIIEHLIFEKPLPLKKESFDVVYS